MKSSGKGHRLRLPGYKSYLYHLLWGLWQFLGRFLGEGSIACFLTVYEDIGCTLLVRFLSRELEKVLGVMWFMGKGLAGREVGQGRAKSGSGLSRGLAAIWSTESSELDHKTQSPTQGKGLAFLCPMSLSHWPPKVTQGCCAGSSPRAAPVRLKAFFWRKGRAVNL